MESSDQSIGKKILGFFIKQENSQPVSTRPAEPQGTAAPGQPTNEPPAKVTSSTGDVDIKFVKHFVDLFEKSNLPGPDYFEYKEALKNMEGLGLSEEKKFQAAWASFSAMSGIKDGSILITSASQYIEMLSKDHASFMKDADKAIEQRVGALNGELKKMQEDKALFTKQISELQDKINANTDRIGQISKEISEQSNRITENRSQFEITYNSFVNQIKSDLEKIKQFIR